MAVHLCLFNEEQKHPPPFDCDPWLQSIHAVLRRRNTVAMSTLHNEKEVALLTLLYLQIIYQQSFRDRLLPGAGWFAGPPRVLLRSRPVPGACSSSGASTAAPGVMTARHGLRRVRRMMLVPVRRALGEGMVFSSSVWLLIGLILLL